MSQSSIEVLKAQVVAKGGLANPNRFRAFIPVPGFVRQDRSIAPLLASGTGSVAQSMYSLNVLCESINFPGKQIETLDYSMYRNPLKIPTGYINDDITITFRLTEDFYAKAIFEKWQRGIINQKTYTLRYLEEYVTDIKLEHQDKQDQSKYGITLRDAYPVTLGAVAKSQTTTDSILTLDVTFSCRDVIIESKFI
tara:strand:- start:120 stop:704 length:585 start_codon:yes stop_codon:yes gene_type:complete